jgi:hypothetical protein
MLLLAKLPRVVLLLGRLLSRLLGRLLGKLGM